MIARRKGSRPSNRGRTLACAMLAGLVVAAGCGRQAGPRRYPISGTVTYAGKPLAAGKISFEPDTDRGNTGPGGYGDIVAGRYQTYRSMGAVGGPHRVVIEGYAGDSPEKWRKRSPLFPAHVTTVELPLERASVDFDVPAGGR